jgi:hypothetical protein
MKGWSNSAAKVNDPGFREANQLKYSISHHIGKERWHPEKLYLILVLFEVPRLDSAEIISPLKMKDQPSV